MQLYDVDVVIGVRMDDDMFYIHEGNGLKPRRVKMGCDLNVMIYTEKSGE